MAKLITRILGTKSLMQKLRAMPEELRAPVRQAVQISVIKVHGDAVTALNRGPATGRIYEKYKPRRTHKASAPGDAPMTDTGALAALTTWRMADDGLSGVVESLADYGRHLEFGTGSMLARPWLFPAFEKNRPGIIQRIAMAIKRTLGRLPGGIGVLAGIKK